MTTEKKTTILERITEYSGQNLTKVFEATKDSYSRYIANLILTSQELARRSEAVWDYKSLTHFGEEDFAKSGNAIWFLDRQEGLNPDWITGAAKEFGNSVCRALWYSESEGVILYVNEGGKFRPAQVGDAPFDFVQRLTADAMTFDLALERPPSWADELFVNKKNLEAHALIWYNCSDISSLTYARDQRAKAEAVWRETKRLMGDGSLACDASESKSEPINAEKPLGTNERNTLLTIIAALAKAVKINIDSPGKAALSIEGLTDELGAHVSKRAIEDHLKKIPGALEVRMQ